VTAGAAIALPPDALVVLIGPAGSGKTTFASRHFAPTQVVSSDEMRGLIADDPSDQRVTDDAFRLLHELIAMRLRRGRLTVVDATNVEAWAREQLLDHAWRARRPAVAIVLDVSLDVCLERNAARAGGRLPPAAVRRQHRWLAESLAALPHEGFGAVHVLDAAEIDSARIELIPTSAGATRERRGR
jgi:predicted kinase